MNNCPQCGWKINFSPLIPFAGCKRCRWGGKEYRMCQLPYGQFDFNEYARLMYLAIEKIEVEELCKGVLDENI